MGSVGRGYGLELVGLGMCLPPTGYNPRKGYGRLGVPRGIRNNKSVDMKLSEKDSYEYKVSLFGVLLTALLISTLASCSQTVHSELKGNVSIKLPSE